MSDELRNAVTPHNAVAAWGLASNSRGQPLSTHDNVGLVLDHRPEILRGAHYDEFLDRVITTGREWRDDDDTTLAMWLQGSIGLSGVTPGMVAMVVSQRLRATPRHCVRDWLESLVWDDEPRIGAAMQTYWGATALPSQPEDYLCAVSRNFFLSLCARIRRPGCKADCMVVLEGEQGVGKERSLTALARDWYMVSQYPVTSMDFFRSLRGKWVVEIGELDSFNRGEKERIKLAVSTATDRCRTPHARRAEDVPRQCQFVGTTNKDDWGNDDTGLRRFWPIRVGRIDVDAIASDRDQLFAEAWHRLHEPDATWWQMPASALAAQADRQADDVWTLTVLDWLAGQTLREDITSAEVLSGALKLADRDMGRIEQLRVGTILRLAGWKRQTVRREGRPTKSWTKRDWYANDVPK